MHAAARSDSAEVVTAQEGDHCEARNVEDHPLLVAAYLWYDGSISVEKPAEFVPITEPFYTQGRPEREAVPGGTRDCIDVGGIPIVSQRLYHWLCILGAQGRTAELIYRGHNKQAYDTAQEGYCRFLPTPIYSGSNKERLLVDLPRALPAVFAIHADRHVKAPEPGIRTEYHIGLSLPALNKLQKVMPTIGVAPLLRVSR